MPYLRKARSLVSKAVWKLMKAGMIENPI